MTEEQQQNTEATPPPMQAAPNPVNQTTAPKATSGLAIASLVLSLLGISIPGVICGHISLSRIKKDPEGLTGGGMALAGVIVGYVSIAITFLMIIPLMAAIAIPSFVTARDTAQLNGCINNMRMIDSGKEQWALANMKAAGDEPDVTGVNTYIKGNTTPLCPFGGSYTYNVIGVDPECSKHGSMMSAQKGDDSF